MKKEITVREEILLGALKEAINALNQITNKSLNGKFKNTYDLCSYLEKITN